MAAAGKYFFKRGVGVNYDTIIKNARLFNGETFYPRPADIALSGNKIALVGKIEAPARKSIDASGFLVSPGFIDVHTHCDMAVFDILGVRRSLKDESVRANLCYLYQGVATVVSGNCGLGVCDTEKWFGAVKEMGFGTNVLHLIPHGRLVDEITGAGRGTRISPAQSNMIKNRIEEELEKGACGISTGLEYYPDVFAEADDLADAAKIAAKYGGIYATHIGDERGTGVIDAIREAVETGRSSLASVEISHLKITAPLCEVKAADLFEVIEKARGEGVDVNAD